MSLSACGRLNIDAALDAPVDASSITNTAPADWTDGTRLHAVRRGAGTNEVFAYWHDTVLNVDCMPHVAEDGVVRCLPVAFTVQPNVFANAACTQNLAGADTGNVSCGLPAQLAVEAGDIKRIRALTFEHAGARYLKSGNSCDLDTVTGPERTYYEVGGPVAAAGLVGSHEEILRNHDLGYREIVFDDGARMVEGAYDYRFDAPVTLYQTAIDRAMLVPTAQASSAQLAYTDSACTHGVAVPDSPDVEMVVLRGTTVCGDHFRAFSRGAEVTTPLYGLTAAGCSLTGASDRAFEIGPPRTDLPTVEQSLLPASGGVQRARWRTSDGLDLPADHLWDPQASDWCDPAVLATGELVCAPWRTLLSIEIFVNSTCAGTTYGVSADCVEPGGATYFPTSMGNLFTCDGFRQMVIEHGSPYSQPEAYLRTEQGCISVDLAATPLGSWPGNGILTATGLPPMNLRR